MSSRRKQPPADIWQDPLIRSLLKERPADDIQVMDCPVCGRMSYYNQGSHFTCRFCDRTWYVFSEGEEPPDDRPSMSADSMRSLADTVGDGEADIP